MKRCTTRWKGGQCKRTLPKSDERKTCVKCRSKSAKYERTKKGKVVRKRASKKYQGTVKQKATQNRFAASDKGKACVKRSKNSTKGKANTKKYNCSENGKARMKLHKNSAKGKASTKKYITSAKGKATKSRIRKKYNGSEKGKASYQRQSDRKVCKLSCSLYKMVRGVHDRPATFGALGIFADNADTEAFFESTKTEPWMKGAPWGKRWKDTLAKTVLQIGHRIPKVWYSHNDEDEIKKAWGRQNLFAQCAVENHDANDRNILTREQWMALKPIWPKQCTTMTDENAWAWAANNVDNITRKKERAAAKVAVAGPSNEAESNESNNDDYESNKEDDASVKLAPSDDSESDNNDEECDEEALASIVFAPSDDDLD